MDSGSNIIPALAYDFIFAIKPLVACLMASIVERPVFMCKKNE